MTDTQRDDPLTSGRLPRALREWSPIALIIITGLAIRMAMLLTPRLGHASDVDLFVSWTQEIASRGLTDFVANTGFCDYPPLMLLIFWCVGKITGAIGGVVASDVGLRMVLKAPAILADLASVVVIYRYGRRAYGLGGARAASALFFLNPAVFYNSAYWGQVDAIHSLFLLVSVLLLAFKRWTWSGAAAGLALALKLQSAAVWPLVLFEAYRVARWRGCLRVLGGAVVSMALVAVPFLSGGVADDVFRRSYVNVVGQYPDLSRNAYNVWYLGAEPSTPDTTLPTAIASRIAHGRVSFAENESVLAKLTWRTISLVGYAIAVAVVLSLYSFRANSISRIGAAGLLVIVFFMIPTEMHERYAHPALVLLPLWAVTAVWRERAYVAACVLLLLNIAAILPPADICRHLATMQLAVLALLAVAVFGKRTSSPELPPDPVAAESAPPSHLICWFRRITWSAVAAFGLGLAFLFWPIRFVTPPAELGDALYLDTLKSEHVSGWGTLKLNRSVSHALIHLGDRYYLRGMGTHSPSRLSFELPPGYAYFEAIGGINRTTHGQGSVVLGVELDGKRVFTSSKITGHDSPVEVKVLLGGAKRLTLRADATEDGQRADHVDWALARVVRDGE